MSIAPLLRFRRLLKSCIATRDLAGGRTLHSLYLKSFIPPETYIHNHFVLLYSRCRHLNHARQMFDDIPHPNVFSYNALLAAYAHESQTHLAIDLFARIPDPDLVSYNTILSAYAAGGRTSDALTLFARMRCLGSDMDGFTLSSVVSSLAHTGAEQLHATAITTGLYVYVSVSNSLICCYSRTGLLTEAEHVFDEIPAEFRDEISWNCMIVAYGQHRQGQKALSFFQDMVRRGFTIDMYTLASVLTAFTTVKNLPGGEQFHSFLIKSAFEKNSHVGSGLIDLYSKCGSILDAKKVFDGGQQLHSLAIKLEFPTDLVSVNNALIAMYSKCGNLKEADKLFSDEGWRHFNSMKADHGMEPGEEHYSCMINLLARAGEFSQAEKMIDTMPFDPGTVGWAALLGACRTHGNLELGTRAAGKMLELDPSNASAYVMMANMHASSGNWEEMAKSRRLMRDRGVRKKNPGCSWIEMGRRVHVFVADDVSHPRIREIHAFLEEMMEKMKREGYVVDARWWTARDDVGEGEVRLRHHSEKLAVAFGLMETTSGVGAPPILVMKNLRICGDCHNAIKFMSKIAVREITRSLF
ncbi:Pentatricopeptide repeat-containing protein [Platanthera zijinensis]|uniref:Pentatricopeptide repeat-containing protein n=1 Tax=Platanthera zijinensis TaxID=2320716 RepID=A0AAP0BSP8_9ASPA